MHISNNIGFQNKVFKVTVSVSFPGQIFVGHIFASSFEKNIDAKCHFFANNFKYHQMQ